jgi:hypothetical protein
VSEPEPPAESWREPTIRERADESGRAAHVIAQLYYYLVAAIGVGFVLGGVIAVLFGLRALVLPEEFQETRDAFRTMLNGLAFALTGAALLWWHLREARRREDRPLRAAFWGRSLYFHLVAFVALWFVVGGVIAMLNVAVEAALPHCDFPVAEPIFPGSEPGVTFEEPVEGVTATQASCFPSPAEAGRRALDAAIFIIAAGPVWWWHLRQGRRATDPVVPPRAGRPPASAIEPSG